MSDDKQKIKFPCRWEFRLIAMAESCEKTRASVAAIGTARKKELEVISGEASGGGKYQALRVACQVDSIEEARELAGMLGKAEGVRFLI